MEFEELQVLWNKQDSERLFAINEDAMYRSIQRKRRSVERLLDLLEWMMIGVNLIVAIVLWVDTVRYAGPQFQLIISGMYGLYLGVALARRAIRRRGQEQFEESMLGELDKAIWGMDYLIRQSRGIVWWYLAPVLLVAAALLALNGKGVWALALVLGVLPLSYFGSRWEVRRFFLPKRRNLVALRKRLLEAPPE